MSSTATSPAACARARLPVFIAPIERSFTRGKVVGKRVSHLRSEHGLPKRFSRKQQSKFSVQILWGKTWRDAHLGIGREARGRSKLGSSISVREARVPERSRRSSNAWRARRPEDCDACPLLGSFSFCPDTSPKRAWLGSSFSTGAPRC
jgi:hypothetical protein